MTRALVITRRLYAAALALWPRSLRERYGHDMRETFDALSADAAARGRHALVALLATEMIDLTRTMRTARKVAPGPELALRQAQDERRRGLRRILF